jgi:hypothetical protein
MLTPIAISPNQTNPDLSGSAYRNCLTNWVNYLRNTAGLPCTKDSAEISVYNRSVLTSLPEKEQGSLPREFKLYQNFPNPFNPSTVITFDLPKNSIASLVVYDILGNEVDVLTRGMLSQGRYSIEWNAANMPSGIYYYVFKSDGFSETKKMIIVK